MQWFRNAAVAATAQGYYPVQTFEIKTGQPGGRLVLRHSHQLQMTERGYATPERVDPRLQTLSDVRLRALTERNSWAYLWQSSVRNHGHYKP